MAGAPTIRNVARAAGVSVGTVSRVLNGHKSVSDDVRRKVMRAIRKLDYEPDRVAQSMRLGVTRTVACAIRDISIPTADGTDHPRLLCATAPRSLSGLETFH